MRGKVITPVWNVLPRPGVGTLCNQLPEAMSLEWTRCVLRMCTCSDTGLQRTYLNERFLLQGQKRDIVRVLDSQARAHSLGALDPIVQSPVPSCAQPRPWS